MVVLSTEIYNSLEVKWCMSQRKRQSAAKGAVLFMFTLVAVTLISVMEGWLRKRKRPQLCIVTVLRVMILEQCEYLRYENTFWLLSHTVD